MTRCFILTVTLLLSLGCNNPEPAFEIDGTLVQFGNSQPEQVTYAKSVLAKLGESDAFDRLVESVFCPKCDWVHCEIFKFDRFPNLELISLHQNKIDEESASKPPEECVAAQLLIDRTTIKVVDMKIETGYSNLVRTLDGDWVVDWQTPSGEIINFEVTETGFVPWD